MTDDQEPPPGSLAGRLDRPVTFKAAVELVGKHPQTIRRWIQSGTLEAFVLGHRELRVTRGSLQPFTDNAGVSDEPAPAVPGRPAGGLYYPEWVLFDGAPFAYAPVSTGAPDPGLNRGS
ncbi:hypothetical protein [Patulibacter medicamentivorans]|uniref:hypothetical protein n=1 Tax=Patulibacter medicamentivorans TaxID=1097667 RepID=UPI0002E9BD7C|nr:hypothetical protein [Patulibacter medicamentivorans]